MSCKIAWLARFSPALTRHDARLHWTNVHGAIGAQVPGMVRYQQNHVIGPMPGSPAPADDRYEIDGYSLGWWPTRRAYDDAMATDEWAAMGADAPNVFDREFFWGMSAVLEEHVIRDGPEEGVKVAWVVSFPAGADPEPLRRHWREIHGPLALQAPGILRYVQNHAIESVGPLGREPTPLRFSGFSECWFADEDACADALRSTAWRALREDGLSIFDYDRLWGFALETREIEVGSDSELVASVAAVLAVPRREPPSSFVLHAPLELAARSALLPLIAPHARGKARLRIREIAARYETFEPMDLLADADRSDADRAESDRADLAESGAGLLARLGDAISSGDLGDTDRAASAVARSVAIDDLVEGLLPLIAPMTGAAAHAPIFLHHLARRERLGGLRVSLLRPLARALAMESDWRIRWTDGWAPADATDLDGLRLALTQVATIGPPDDGSIHALLMQVDRSGLARDTLGPVLGPYTDRAARTVIRVAARSMLTGDPDHIPYGWTHCFTLPQALLSAGRGTADADRCLALAATQVLAFRAAYGDANPDAWTEVPAETSGFEGLPRIDPTALATEAAVRSDAHLAKYVLACLDAADDDPAAAGLYHLAGRRLVDYWIERGEDEANPFG